MATATKLEETALACASDVFVEDPIDQTVEQEPADPPVAVASSEAAPIPSKRAVKKAKKTKSDDVVDAESSQNIAATIDHPYLSFLHKRIRLYKKKLEKIRALETARANEGKVLNDQQQEVVGNKALVEKMIAEFESLREQFIEVYLKEEAEKKEAKKQQEKQQEATNEVESKAVPVVESANQTEEEPATKEKMSEDPSKVELPRDAFAYVEDLLRTLHAVTLHQALGKDVPLVLDYFSKVVLGTTRPPAEVPFEENLAESLEEATRYLTKSEKIVALEYTYKDLRAMVEKLGARPASSSTEELADASPNTTDRETASAEEIDAVQAPAAEELPHINFFTESQLEEGEEEEVMTEDKDNQHEALAEAIEPTVSEEEASEDSLVEEKSTSVAAPPKSFAAAAAGGASGVKNVWKHKSKYSETAPGGSSDEKANQRRRSQGRSKNGNNSNSPRSGDGKTSEGSDGAAGGSSKASYNKPRRPRPQRSNDENNNQVNQAVGKVDDRRPRSERPMRKQQPAQQYRQVAAV